MTVIPTPSALALEGDDAFKAKDYDLAIAKYSAALAQDPTSLAARHGRGTAYVRQRTYDLALEDAERCINDHPKAACSYALKGLALCWEQHYAQALASYEVALEIEDNTEIEQIVDGIKALHKAKLGVDSPTRGRLTKTTKSGRPFCKDIYDLFSILVISLRLGTYKVMFRVHEHAFTYPSALTHLASLKLCQSRRRPDPTDPSRFITESTTTAFALTPDTAQGMCARFLDARLLDNVASPGSGVFAERGVFTPTPKGLHVLGQFVSRNGIDANHLRAVFAARPVCPALVHFERRPLDDEIVASPAAVRALFRRFAGKRPNWRGRERRRAGEAQAYRVRCRGVALVELTDTLGAGAKPIPFCFEALAAVEWLCDFSAVCGKEEAGEMAAHFVRLGLVRLVYDSSEKRCKGVVYVVQGPRAHEDASKSTTLPTTEFRCTRDAVYQITPEGRKLAGWDEDPSPSSTPPSPSPAPSRPRPPLETPAPRSRSPFALLSTLTTSSPRSRSPRSLLSPLSPPSPSRPSRTPPSPSTTAIPIAITPETAQSPTTTETRDALAFAMSPTSLATHFPPFDMALSASLSPTSPTSPTSIDTLITSASTLTLINPPSTRPDPSLARLRTIIEHAPLRALLRSAVRGTPHERALSFYLDVQELRRRFVVSSSVFSGLGRGRSQSTAGQEAARAHHEALLARTFALWETYLASGARSALSLREDVREEFSAGMMEVLSEGGESGGVSGVVMEGEGEGWMDSEVRLEWDWLRRFDAMQLGCTVRLLEVVQSEVFHRMAGEVLDMFVASQGYEEVEGMVEKFEMGEAGVSVWSAERARPMSPPGLGAGRGKGEEEGDGVYVTVAGVRL